MATKIKLMRLGKMREPHYRIVVADARTKRDGRAIETIGEYHPKNDPSVIKVDAERAAYWLGVGAQPTEAVDRDPQGHRRLAEVQGPAGAGADEGGARPSPTSRRCSTPRWPTPTGEPSAEATTPRKRAATKAPAKAAKARRRRPRPARGCRRAPKRGSRSAARARRAAPTSRRPSRRTRRAAES